MQACTLATIMFHANYKIQCSETMNVDIARSELAEAGELQDGQGSMLL